MTAVAVSCPCLCATVIQTATTKQTRQTAAINTKVRACRQNVKRCTWLVPNPNPLTECGGQKTGPYGHLSSPNHPRNYPHQQVHSEPRETAERTPNWTITDVCFTLISRSSVFHQLCIWYLSVEEGEVITLSFRNFSLETQDVCEFDYVEVHDSVDAGAGRVLGR